MKKRKLDLDKYEELSSKVHLLSHQSCHHFRVATPSAHLRAFCSIVLRILPVLNYPDISLPTLSVYRFIFA